MPLAGIRPDPVRAPDVAEKPLDLMWRSSTTTNVPYVPLFGLQALALLISVGVAFFGLVAPLLLPPQPSAEDLLSHTLPQRMSAIEIVLRIAGACAVVAITVGLCVLLARAIPYLFGRNFGIAATSSGIDARTELGSRVHMAWDEMRLLEVDKGDAQSQRHFALYTQGKRIGWAEYRSGLGTQYVPVGATASEMALRQAALLSLIAARTGLAPRTLTKALKRKPASARAAKRSSSAVLLLVGALFLAGITAADVLFPVTPFTWVNWVSAGSLALTTLCLIVASLWTALARRTLPAHASPLSVGAPSLDTPEVAYILGWRTPLLRRLLLIFIGLCLAFNLVPGAWMLILQLAPFLPDYHSEFLTDDIFTFMGRFALALVLGIFGAMGLGLAFQGARAATISIRADKHGLRTGIGPREQLIVWSRVQDISWGPGGSGQFASLVKSDVPTFQITWPAGPQVASTSPPSNDAIPIGADELAALVEPQIGKSIRVHEEA